MVVSLPIKNPYLDDVHESEDDTMRLRSASECEDDEDDDSETGATSDDGQGSENGSAIERRRDSDDRHSKSTKETQDRFLDVRSFDKKRGRSSTTTQVKNGSEQRRLDSSHGFRRGTDAPPLRKETTSSTEVRSSSALTSGIADLQG